MHTVLEILTFDKVLYEFLIKVMLCADNDEIECSIDSYGIYLRYFVPYGNAKYNCCTGGMFLLPCSVLESSAF